MAAPDLPYEPVPPELRMNDADLDAAASALREVDLTLVIKPCGAIRESLRFHNIGHEEQELYRERALAVAEILCDRWSCG